MCQTLKAETNEKDSNTMTKEDSCLQIPITSPVKNLLLVGVSSMFLFMSAQSLEELNSSINFQEGLGTVSLAVLNIASVLASFFIAIPLIRKFGITPVLKVSLLGYVVFVAAHFKPTWYTFIPAAALNGLCHATFHAALWTYVANLGSQYSEISGLSPDVIYPRFYSIVYMFMQCSSIWGSLISFEVLRSSDNKYDNGTAQYCGYSFCDDIVSKNDTNFNEMPKNFYLLCGIYLGISILAIVIILFADKQESKRSDDEISTLQSVIATGKKLRDPFMILVLPISVYGGLQLAFINGDFTKAYITCGFGVSHVGFVQICFGVVSTIFSLGAGHLVKLLGRQLVFVLSTIMDVAVFLWMSFYEFRGTQGLIFLFVITGCHGITNSIWQAQVKALYGKLFPNCLEVAFCILGVYEDLGTAMGYLYSSALCTRTKIFILIGILLVGMFWYAVVEIWLARNIRQNKSTPESRISVISK